MSEPDERVKEGLEHLQNAALELIAAARVILDLAEDAVRDPSDLLARANAMAAAARTVASHAAPHAGDPGPGAHGAQAGGEPYDADSGVQRIRVV